MDSQTKHSHAEPAALPCRVCGEVFESDIWIIVDILERPDLHDKLRASTLHQLTCPACGHADIVNAPLLVFRPEAEPVLLFAPAQGGTQAQDEEQAQALVGIFREGMGGDWRDEWLGRGLTGVPREALPLLMSDDPATAVALAGAHAADEEAVSPHLRQALEEIMLALAAEGVRVNSADDLKWALESRPELKTRLADALKTG